MQILQEYLNKHPIVPYIRECDYAVRKPWSMPERRLLDYLLIYVQEGTCNFRVDRTLYEFHKGEFCFIQPNSLNDLEGIVNTVTPFAHFDVFYAADREQSFPTRAGQVELSAYLHLMQPRLDEMLQVEVPVKLKPKNSTRFRDTFLQVVEFWQDRDPLMQLKAQAGLTELVIMLMEDVLERKQSQRTSPQTLNWITSYFSFHLNEPLSVADMARRANLSHSRFHDLFKQQYGMTPHQYLLEMRINHACELLQNTKLTQQQVADYCGFSDIHHFSKTFKKKLGIAPGQFRNDCKKE
ncbi:hypothetical protein VE23_08020 [Paenibacillus sp. D9]|uniref:helix-turn-helix domain-containing protein n=1 Tax=Paenibacillus TaxID=44249 RepID=UPI00061F55B7|nr:MULTISPECIES: AraC family transcriptional regulator [Paenibacillus]KKC47103.1 hypothetical protein VE23_08020 [Paenibacillus sp. D9]